MNQPPPPFSCSYSPNLPELLSQLNCTLVISTYQAGKVIFISPKNKEHLVQLPRTFNKAMGIAVQENKLGVATKDEIIVLANSTGLAKAYPKKPNTYDALFMPRATYYTGQVDIHDLHWGNNTLWAVNTSFSCVCVIDDNYSFTPVWKPNFVSHLASEDRCHLNGMAMKDGKPLYVSALGKYDTPKGWRETIVNGGLLINMPTNEIIAKNLPMPHAPRLYNGNLYVLLSATGQLAQIEVETGKVNIIQQFSGFVRGMAKHGDYLFIGLSRLRKNSSTFRHLPIADKALWAGIVVVHLPTGSIVGQLKYHASVDEIYDIQVLPNMVRPNILNTHTPMFKMGLSIPTSTYWAASQ